MDQGGCSVACAQFASCQFHRFLSRRDDPSMAGRVVDFDTSLVVEKRASETSPVTKLIYTAITSLDGYVEDANGNFDWGAPDEEVHAFVNDGERPIGLYLYGRRMYETMRFWETAHTLPDPTSAFEDFTEIWQAADKIVYSRSLQTVSSARTRLEQDFDPEAIRHLKATAPTDISIGGAELAAQAFSAGLVDEVGLFLVPVVVGGGKPSLPDHIRLDLHLLDERRFESGVVYLRYALTS
jgi:dihydrofolate reductase